MVRKRGVGLSTSYGATTLRKAESEAELAFAFLLGVGRQRGVPFVGESAGVGGLRARGSQGGACCAEHRG